MITIKGSMNPTVVKTNSGNFAVSGSNWVSVPNGTTLKDLNWVDTTPKIKRTKLQKWEIKSPSKSRPGKFNTYLVKFDGTYSCSCLGYTYHRRCKHITKVSESFRHKSRGRAGAGVV